MSAIPKFLKSLVDELLWYLSRLYKIVVGLITNPRRLIKGRSKIDCDPKLPPEVVRQPDPCIYSQFYLQSLNIGVTWDNPDIRILNSDGFQVDSHNLLADTDYIVEAKISNSSHVSLAIGVAVRCFYRPWSFNSPDRVPIGDGTKIIDVIKRSSWEKVEFNWHTPRGSGHYCIQVECQHPFDLNPYNNLGQENTNIISVAQSQIIKDTLLLWNPNQYRRTFRIIPSTYSIPDPNNNINVQWDRESRTDILSNLRKVNHPELFIPGPEWGINVGESRNNNVTVPAGMQTEIPIEFSIPDNAFSNTQRPSLTLIAIDNVLNQIVGGVTYIFEGSSHEKVA